MSKNFLLNFAFLPKIALKCAERQIRIEIPVTALDNIVEYFTNWLDVS